MRHHKPRDDHGPEAGDTPDSFELSRIGFVKRLDQ
jgi:hypothetical protein